MSLFLTLANLTTTGLVMASGGHTEVAPTQTEIQPQPKEEKITKVTVKKGDYLSKIANKYDTTWRRIYDANKSVKHPDVINPGDKLRIPDDDEKLKKRPLPKVSAAKPAKQAKQAPAPAFKPAVSYYRAPSVSSGSVWDRLAQCESGGNWSYNGPSGYDGGLQFLPSTWSAYNSSYAYAWQAPREVQIATAEKLLAATGGQYSRSWPACSAKLGLP